MKSSVLMCLQCSQLHNASRIKCLLHVKGV
jgi:hypothetical protein